MGKSDYGKQMKIGKGEGRKEGKRGSDKRQRWIRKEVRMSTRLGRQKEVKSEEQGGKKRRGTRKINHK